MVFPSIFATSSQEEYLAGRELVVKASGLAAGKGVLMPQSMAEAKEAVEEVMATWQTWRMAETRKGEILKIY